MSAGAFDAPVAMARSVELVGPVWTGTSARLGIAVARRRRGGGCTVKTEAVRRPPTAT